MSQPLDPALLDSAWTFGDPAASESRLRDLRADHASEAIALSEIDTQIARALGLQGRFDDALAALASITDSHPLVRTRVALEHGRILNSRGDSRAAQPLFAAARQHAVDAGDVYLQVDARHMLAIVDTVRSADWTQQGIALASQNSDPHVRRWLGALHNNLGWHHHDAERFPEALVQFDLALAAYERTGTDEQVRIAHWCRARCLRSLGSVQEALAIQERLHAAGPPDTYVDEELETLRALIEAPPTAPDSPA